MKKVQKVKEWLRQLDEKKSPLVFEIEKVCGNEPGEAEESLEILKKTLMEFSCIYGYEREVIIARAPGRVNLLGTHIDHQGGCVNSAAIKAIFAVASKRQDRKIVLNNIEEKYESREFVFDEGLPSRRIRDWVPWTRIQSSQKAAEGKAGDWSDKVKSVAFYLENRIRTGLNHRRNYAGGMDIVFGSSLPADAGLSSSSAMVACTIEIVLYFWGMHLSRNERIPSVKEAEYYLGTYGGEGDPASIKLGKKGMVSHISFFPFKISYFTFPRRYSLVICDSLKEAKKSSTVRDIFHQKIAGYKIGFFFLKEKFPYLASRLQYLRDINPEYLDLTEAEIYDLILSLPVRMSRKQALEEIPAYRDELSAFFITHKEPEDGYYSVRGICLYGIAECLRAKKAEEFLRKGDIEGFGELINLSHEGDRVTCLEGTKRVPYYKSFSDEVIRKIRTDALFPDIKRKEKAHLWRQPGGYQASCSELDEIVDLARQVQGVIGAGLSGAGMGGSVTILVEKERVSNLLEAVTKYYYEKRNLPLSFQVVSPVEGAGLL